VTAKSTNRESYVGRDLRVKNEVIEQIHLLCQHLSDANAFEALAQVQQQCVKDMSKEDLAETVFPSIAATMNAIGRSIPYTS
jgi:hypothetical protein